MSSVVDSHGPTHDDHGHDTHGHHGGYGGVMRWITTTNTRHRTLSCGFSFIMFMVAHDGDGDPLELFSPASSSSIPICQPVHHMHGLIMVFGAIMPPS